MIIYNITFYFFAIFMLVSALMVITVRNPVNSVLFLILTFFNAAALFILRGAEFLAMSLIIVYVGAVAVLFLFVVMMLDIQIHEVKRKLGRYFLIGAALGGVLFAELLIASSSYNRVYKTPDEISIGNNTEAIGILLYREYVYLFEAVGMILLVAMLGAIVLTLRVRPGVKKQNIHRQNMRDSQKTVTLQDPTKGRASVVPSRTPKPHLKKSGKH